MRKISSFLVALFCFSSFPVVFALGNPASEKCIADGGRLDMVTDEKFDQHGVCTFPEWTVCDEWSYFRWTCVRMITINAVRGVSNATIDIKFPLLFLPAIDRKIKDYISKQVRSFSRDLSDFADGLSGEDVSNFYLIIDCKPVTVTEYYYSVLCDRFDYLWWAHGSAQIETFNFDRKTNTLIGAKSLFWPGRLKLLSDNLYRHFLITLQATDDNSKNWIKTGLNPFDTSYYLGDKKYPLNYKDFTLHASGSKIDTITLYFEPYTISPRSAGTQWVKVVYPSWKIAK